MGIYPSRSSWQNLTGQRDKDARFLPTCYVVTQFIQTWASGIQSKNSELWPGAGTFLARQPNLRSPKSKQIHVSSHPNNPSFNPPEHYHFHSFGFHSLYKLDKTNKPCHNKLLSCHSLVTCVSERIWLHNQIEGERDKTQPPTMKYNYSFILANNNAISIIIFIFFMLLSSTSVPVDCTRLLKRDESFSSVLEGFIMGRAYSGPSHRGAGHWQYVSVLDQGPKPS